MILLIDSGNTRLKLRGLDDSNDEVHTLTHQQIPTLPDLISKYPTKITKIYGVNVAGSDIETSIRNIIHQDISVTWIKAQAHTSGLTNNYIDPHTLGADRWFSLVGAYTRSPLIRRPILVASFGTATTMDTITQDGHFEGGLILPGVDLMLQSLNRGTAQLPLSGIDFSAFPKNTSSAIGSGVCHAQLSALYTQAHRIQRSFKQSPSIIVTGGAWQHIAPYMNEFSILFEPSTHFEYHPYLVLDGLAHQIKQGLVY